MGLVEERVKDCLSKIKDYNKLINAFIEVRNEKDLINEARSIDSKKNKGKLYGKVIAVKSNICVSGLHASCSSKTLEDYESPYDATVISRIKAEDGIILGMTNCDEFACGWTGETSAFGKVHNPILPDYVPGGSSSGSVAAVAAGFCDMALGSDTGGSIRVPSSFCGVVGIKPSYGCVSRYGLIDLSMSIDQIGPIAKNIDEAALLLEVIKGYDEMDTTTFKSKPLNFTKPGKIKFGIVSIPLVDSRIFDLMSSVVEKVSKDSKWVNKSVSLKYIDLGIQTYHPLVWTELFSATRRMDGRRFGEKIEDSAGSEVLRRIYGGEEISKAEFKGQYYHKALAVKEMIKSEFERVLKEVDCIFMPTVPFLPWKFGTKISMEELYAVDVLTIPGSLAEICAISVPIGKIDGKPVGLQIVCAKGNESKMISIAKEVESAVSNHLI
jgi:aspartyl-tRNA(Asn)/glutamyl-tRNA(Gln) amidotransferase subunit A